MAEMVLEHGLRRVGEMIGRGHEQVRKFTRGMIAVPQDRTRKAMAELFLRHNVQSSRVAEAPVVRLSSPELRSILPEGMEAATSTVRKIFELARRHPDELPEHAAVLERHLVKQLKEEYRQPGAYTRPRRRGGTG